jgi:hypothetical protein
MGDVGGREAYAIWCNGQDLDRAACEHMCKSEIGRGWWSVRLKGLLYIGRGRALALAGLGQN